MKHRLRAVALAALGAASVAVFAQDIERPSLRERIRERIEQRRAAQAPAAAPAAGDGAFTLRHDGQLRRYLVHVPAGLDPRRPAPLVLAFHGGGGSAELMADDARYGWIGEADREGFVVVFPNGFSRLPGGNFATWNAGACCGEARDRNIDDVGFARAVVADVRRRMAIDPTRIFAVGMSNGGMLSHRLACDAADLFRAVASVAGTDATLSCAPARPIPVLHIHARDDDHVLFDGGAGQGAFRDAGKVADFVSVSETIARWVKRDQCSPAAQRSLEAPGAFCETHAGCRDGVSVQLCVTETGGHSWPGADTVRRGKAPASQALDATAVSWRFFRDAAR